jgi:hypothetical protein
MNKEKCIVCGKKTVNYACDETLGTYWCEPCAKEEDEVKK